MRVRIAVLLLALAAIVVVPFLIWQDPLNALSAELLDRAAGRGLIAVAVVALLILDVLLPIPSSVVSVAAGAALGFELGALACLIGMTGGCLLGYLLGTWLGAGRLVGERDRRAMQRLFARYGAGALAVARPVPVLAEVSVVLAGVARMKPGALLAYTGAANLGISTAYSAVGHFAMQWNSFLLAFLGATLIPAGTFGALRLARRRTNA